MPKKTIITVLPNGCCVSNHETDIHGYPQIRFLGKTGRLHRFMFMAKNGIIPSSVIVRHTCDNPVCVNPNHLIPGTHADNVADRVARGRSAIGERHGRSKLTVSDVREIRASNRSQADLAMIYGVDRKVIKRIRERKAWAWVDDDKARAAVLRLRNELERT